MAQPIAYSTISDLGTGNAITPGQRRNRRQFARLWKLTRSRLESKGWYVNAGSISQLYIRDGNARRLDWAWILPHARTLRIRLTFKNAVKLRRARPFLESVKLPWITRRVITLDRVRRDEGEEWVLEIRLRLEEVLSKVVGARKIQRRLANTVLPFINKAG